MDIALPVMRRDRFRSLLGIAAAALAPAAPWLVPGLLTQLAFLWLMIVFALTWDILGGQMGYNSLATSSSSASAATPAPCSSATPGCPMDPASPPASPPPPRPARSPRPCSDRACWRCAVTTSAIATLGLGIAAGDLAAGWNYIGAASGIVAPQFPGRAGSQEQFFDHLLPAITLATFTTLRWLYGTRFGAALNAIRDDEDRAEAMGIRTTANKTAAWCIAAFFLGLAGGAAGNLVGYIDPREFAFAGSSFGVWMVPTAILGGRGSLWGPVLGATIFHATQELFWTYLLGWQRVAMGLFIVIVVVFLPDGLLGWLRRRRGDTGTE